MAKKSAGLVVYKINNKTMYILLVHPGGPFFKNKDDGVWSIPKGEYTAEEEPLDVAIKEFKEETGNSIVSDKYIPMRPVKTKGGKIISAWIVEADFQKPFICSNEFMMEWLLKSGKHISVPEVDDAAWFTLDAAKIKIHPSQLSLIEELEIFSSSTIGV